MKRAFGCVVTTSLALVFACQGATPSLPVHGLHLAQVHDAEDWFLAMRAFPNGIPAGARVKALVAAAQADGGLRRRPLGRPLHPEAGGLNSWFPVGPSPIGDWSFDPSNSLLDRLQVSGRVTAIEPNPANTKEVWLGTATGGVWHTLNAQTTDPDWVPVDGLQFADGLSVGTGGVVPVGAMAMSIGSLRADGCTQAGCSTVWIGTGEDGVRRDTYYGAGLFKLTQEMTQNRIHPEDGTPGLLTQAVDFRYGSVVAMDLAPHTSGLAPAMAVAVSSGTTSGSTEATVTSPDPASGYGIYVSTDGVHFNKLSFPSGTFIDNSLPTDVKFDPNDPQGRTLLVGYMSKNIGDANAVRGILKTPDLGATWCSVNQNMGFQTCAGSNAATSCQSTTGLLPGSCVSSTQQVSGQDEVMGYVTLAFSPNPGGSNRVYARIGQCGQRADDGCVPLIFGSTDDAKTWNPIVLGFPQDTSSYDRYTHALAVVPNANPANEQLVVGGVQLLLCPSQSGNCQFADQSQPDKQGNTMTIVHSDHHAIVFPDPTNAALAYDGNDGGFVFTTTGDTGWTSGNSTLNTSQLDSIAVVDHNLVAGLQDEGQVFFNGSRTWQAVTVGDGGGAVGYQYGNPAQTAWFFTTQRNLPVRAGNDPTVQPQQVFLGRNFPSSADTEFVIDSFGACLAGTCTYSSNTGNSFTGGTCNTAADCPVGVGQTAFFPPLALNRVKHDLYIASTEIYMSAPTTDEGHRGDAPWSAISPILATPGNALIPTLDTDNVITALGIGDDGAVYAGTYVGEVWVSQAPCASNGCWHRVGGPMTNTSLPLLPVSSIAVTPGDSSTAYVAYSGFGTQNHVWVGTGYGSTWNPMSAGLLDAPANTIRFDTLKKLWLGTDIGIYSFSGSTWTRDTTLPFMPVTDISSWPDQTGGERLFAATHGRGAWFLTSTPSLSTLEGWSNGSIWDVPVHGVGFNNQSGVPVPCTVSLYQQSGGNPCASGPLSVNTTNPGGGVPGGIIQVDANGQLQTSDNATFNNVPVVWACKEGTCLGNVPIKNCNQDSQGNPDEISTVVVDCGPAGKGETKILNAPTLGDPPSSSLVFDPPNPQTGATWTFEAVVSITAPTGALLLCRAPVTVDQTADGYSMAQSAAAALNASPDCQAAGVRASANAPIGLNSGEDPALAIQSGLTVRAKIQTGSELFVTFRAAPSVATGMCFTLMGLGNPALHQSAIMQTVVSTASSGAAGGSVQVVEATEIGNCTQNVKTTAGMTSTQVAAAIVEAFDGVTNPGPANCLARNDALDLQASGATIFSVTAHHLMLCSFDEGVGFTTAPDGVSVPNLPPQCGSVTADPSSLWPPDHKFYPVALPGATDPDGDPVTLTVTQVRQDEDPTGQIDAKLVNGTLYLRSERDGTGDGRVYHIQFTASDGQGGTCNGNVTVCVPHDQGSGKTCIDEGPLYASGVP